MRTSVRAIVRAIVRASMRAIVRAIVRTSVRASMRAGVRANVRANVRASMRAGVRASLRASTVVGCMLHSCTDPLHGEPESYATHDRWRSQKPSRTRTKGRKHHEEVVSRQGAG